MRGKQGKKSKKNKRLLKRGVKTRAMESRAESDRASRMLPATTFKETTGKEEKLERHKDGQRGDSIIRRRTTCFMAKERTEKRHTYTEAENSNMNNNNNRISPTTRAAGSRWCAL
jgi:hypothetical protein